VLVLLSGSGADLTLTHGKGRKCHQSPATSRCSHWAGKSTAWFAGQPSKNRGQRLSLW